MWENHRVIKTRSFLKQLLAPPSKVCSDTDIGTDVGVTLVTGRPTETQDWTLGAEAGTEDQDREPPASDMPGRWGVVLQRTDLAETLTVAKKTNMSTPGSKEKLSESWTRPKYLPRMDVRKPV